MPRYRHIYFLIYHFHIYIHYNIYSNITIMHVLSSSFWFFAPYLIEPSYLQHHHQRRQKYPKVIARTHPHPHRSAISNDVWWGTTKASRSRLEPRTAVTRSRNCTSACRGHRRGARRRTSGSFSSMRNGWNRLRTLNAMRTQVRKQHTHSVYPSLSLSLSSVVCVLMISTYTTPLLSNPLWCFVFCVWWCF